jgi:hypothetical protein
VIPEKSFINNNARPHLLASLFVYVFTYLFFDRSRPLSTKTAAAKPSPEPKKRQEKCDNDDGDAGDSDDVSLTKRCHDILQCHLPEYRGVAKIGWGVHETS